MERTKPKSTRRTASQMKKKIAESGLTRAQKAMQARKWQREQMGGSPAYDQKEWWWA